MNDNKNQLANAVIWDKYFGLDFIVGDKKQNFNLNNLFAKKNIVNPKKNFINIKPDKEIMNSILTLDEVYKEIDKIAECPNLKTPGNKPVYCDGVQNATIMLIGEAPGEEESKQGIPFCGASGKLLDTVLNTIEIDRKTNLYITNSVFWRPPANRKPTDEEIAVCRPFVEKQIEIIKPKIIILCGAVACQTILKSKDSMSNLRQKTKEYITSNGFTTTCIAIYHPAFLLRNPIAKKAMWADMLFIKKLI